jgi:cyclopropane-fatty-acyl-phospholipid synthase
VAVIRVAARNAGSMDRIRRRLAFAREPYQRARALFRRNTPRRSRRDIAAHYDLGNRLFELMLDPTMMYSCAYFAEPGITLEEASRAKLDLICRKLELGPGDRLLEIGTGWGALAVHAAVEYGCHVTTTTISREQHEAAAARIRAAGVEDRVTLLLRDYRELEGTYDKLVSVEMIEAVGWKDFGTFFARCSALLEPDGRMLLQAITMDDRAYRVERASRSFIRTLVFPNGCLPSQEVIARCVARRTDLRTVHLEDLTGHYAETLRRWRANVEAAAERLEELGYDERFRRLWRLYLSYCEAGFAERRIGRAPALTVLGLRVAYGAGLIAAPERLGRPWLGPAVAGAPVKVPLRALGVREVALHAGAAAAMLRGEPLRPWLGLSVLGDVTDIAWTTFGRRELPAGAPGKTALAAGGSALLSLAVAALVSE